MRLPLAGLLALLAPAVAAEPLALAVAPSAETEGTRGDADDPAIWAPEGGEPLILGTDKTQGLFVYGLDGAVRQVLPDGELNNVDVRPFSLRGEPVGLAGATRRDDETIVLYLIEDGALRPATPWQHAAIPPDAPEADDIYGFALGVDPAGAVSAFVNFKTGHVAQWRVHEAQGTLALEHVRTWRVPSQPEGMVVDDAAGMLYVGEEDAGIWRFPLAGGEGERVAQVPSDCLPRDDVEGLAVVEGPTRRLVASAQGVHRAAVFRITDEGLECEAMVEVAPSADGALDGVTETDGLDATSGPAGDAFPGGLLVMMDDQNAGFTTNFKLVDWAAVAAGLPD